MSANPTRKTRVLHLITRLDEGGSAGDTVDMVRGFDHSRYDVSLAYGSTSQLSEADLNELRSVCADFSHIPSLRRDPHPVHDLKALRDLYAYIRRGRFDIVHTHTSKAGFVGRIAAWLARTPAVIHSPHGHVFYGFFGPLKTNLYILLEIIAAWFTDCVLCLTQIEIEEHLERHIGKRKMYRVLHSGVHIERFLAPGKPRAEMRVELGIPADARVVGAVARLDPIKGIGHLIEAFFLMADEFPDLRLLLVGDGEQRDEFHALVRERGFADRVIFTGQRRDVPDLLHAMDIYALPSLNEGYGKVIVEAMSAGLPVVASAVGGVSALVQEGKTGLLIPAADPPALAAALGRLLRDPALAASMGAEGRNAVGADLSVEAMVRKLDGIYQEFLK